MTIDKIVEYRGVEGFVVAEVLEDSADNYTTGTVYPVAGVSQIERATDSSNEAHYYNNIPAVVVSSTSADNVTIDASAIPLDRYAMVTGQEYDALTGSLIEGQRTVKYFAVGYITKDTDGNEVYVWRYKGTFNVPTQTNVTEDNGTTANGQQLVYTGISTTHKFTKTGKGAKALNVEVSKGLADVEHFFDTVTTPDTLSPVTPVTKHTVTNTLTGCTTNNAAAEVVDGTPYAALITANTGLTLGAVTVTMGGTDITSTAVNGGAITVTSVTGDLVITATAS